MSFLAPLGDYALDKYRFVRHVVAIAASAVFLAFKPSSWPRTVRSVFARQIYYSGFQALTFMLGLSVFVGLAVVAHAQFWMSRLGTSEYLGPFLVIMIFRESGPLLVNLVMVGRSGTAIATELAGMKVRHEVKVLDSQGIDPMVYLVMPRVLGMMISVFALSMFFAVASLASGYFCAQLLGVAPGSVGLFLSGVMNGITHIDVFNFLAKTLLPGLMIGAISCNEGLRVDYVTEIPQSATRCVMRGNTAVFLICGVISMVTYL